MHHDWDQGVWESSRVQIAAFQVAHMWIKCAVTYGFAHNSHTNRTKRTTNALLKDITKRIVIQSKGPRIMMGDWNLANQDVDFAEMWREYGFFDAQEYAHHRWGQEIQVTCKDKSVKDHIWLSKDFIPWMQRVTVDNTWFADHAIIQVDLSPPTQQPVASIWVKPYQDRC